MGHAGAIGARRSKQWPQDGPKMDPRGVWGAPRAAHGLPRGPLGASRGAQEGPEGTQESAKRTQEGPKEVRKTKNEESKNVKNTDGFYCFLASWARQDGPQMAHLGKFEWLSGDVGIA